MLYSVQKGTYSNLSQASSDAEKRALFGKAQKGTCSKLFFNNQKIVKTVPCVAFPFFDFHRRVAKSTVIARPVRKLVVAIRPLCMPARCLRRPYFFGRKEIGERNARGEDSESLPPGPPNSNGPRGLAPWISPRRAAARLSFFPRSASRVSAAFRGSLCRHSFNLSRRDTETFHFQFSTFHCASARQIPICHLVPPSPIA